MLDLGRTAEPCADGRDLKDPQRSPIGRGFPAAILIPGTRDVVLSKAVRTHRKRCRVSRFPGTCPKGRATPGPAPPCPGGS